MFYCQILNFIKGTVAENAPIIPISAQLKYNIDVVCDYIVNSIPIPIRDFTSDPRLIGRYIFLHGTYLQPKILALGCIRFTDPMTIGSYMPPS